MGTPDQPETMGGEVERLRAENQQLRDEVHRLRSELRRMGKYLEEPPRPAASDGAPPEIEWAYQRGDLYDDLGDD